MRHARFETPAAPLGWDTAREHLIRIVDPLGDAIAWLAPEFGGNCVGYAVRRATRSGTDWVHVLRSAGPQALTEDPGHYGCSILSLLPTELSSAAAGSPSSSVAQDRWTFVERDPTSAVLESSLPGVSEDDGSQTVRLRLTARLDGAALSLDLEATNDGARAVEVGIGLQPTFAPELSERHVDQSEQPHRWIQHGLSGQAMYSPCIQAVERGIEIDQPSSEYLVGSVHGARVEVVLREGVQHLERYADSNEQPVSLALLGYVPTDSLRHLPAGERICVCVTIGAVNQEPAVQSG